MHEYKCTVMTVEVPRSLLCIRFQMESVFSNVLCDLDPNWDNVQDLDPDYTTCDKLDYVYCTVASRKEFH